jgi:hypothetical protein
MSTAKGFIQGYNAQAVANEDQVIVAASVTDEQNDMGQRHPMIEAMTTSLAEAGIEERPEKLLADAGYCSEENLAALDDEDPDVDAAASEWKLICGTHNLLQLYRRALRDAEAAPCSRMATAANC